MNPQDQCPACRARLGSSPLCQRCGCDLTLAWRAAAKAQRLAAQAVRAWAAGNPSKAQALAGESLALRRGLLARVMVRLCEGRDGGA